MEKSSIFQCEFTDNKCYHNQDSYPKFKRNVLCNLCHYGNEHYRGIVKLNGFYRGNRYGYIVDYLPNSKLDVIKSIIDVDLKESGADSNEFIKAHCYAHHLN